MNTRTCRECGVKKPVEEMTKRYGSQKPTNLCRPCSTVIRRMYTEFKQRKAGVQV